MDIRLTVDDAGFQRWLRERVRLGKEDVGLVVRQQGKLLAGDLVKMTPPFGSVSGRESFAAQRRVGNRAVDRDISRGFRAVEDLGLIANPTTATGERAVKLLRRGKIDALGALLRNVGIRDFDSGRFIGGAVGLEGMLREHDQIRDGRGRVKKNLRDRRRWGRRRGINALRRERKKHVGRAKRGWAVAYVRLGGRVPAWIGRHGARGSLVDETRGRKRGGRNPKIVLGNHGEEIAEIARTARVVPRALKNRSAKLKRGVQALMRRRWK